MKASAIALHIWVPGGQEVRYYCGAAGPVRGSIAPDWAGDVRPDLICPECIRQFEVGALSRKA